MAERSDREVIDDLIASAMPRTETVQVCARGDLVDEYLALTTSLKVALEDDSGRSIADDRSGVDEIHDQIAAVQEQQDAATTTFQVQSIGALAWTNLLRKHPPRPGVDSGLAFNLETFPPAAVAACAMAPKITVEQAAAMYGTDEKPGAIHSAEWDKLFSAAYVLNETETPHPKLPAAIERLLRSGRSSTTAANAESLADASSAAPDAP